ncbi:MAG: hypothetical protein ACRBF0_13360 [Calditrichia bacterium]
MKKLIPAESDKVLKSQIGEIKNNDDAIKQFLKFFEEFKIKEELEHEEEDMMLFQYGIYDWQNGKGKEFSFGLTRQFEIPDEDEFLQLSLTLFYNCDQTGEVESFNSWSVDSGNLNDWEQLIKNSEGYLKSKNRTPNRIEIGLVET